MLQTFKKRIYVGLANDVTVEEIQERFSKFGKVSNLILKRRTDEFGGLTNFGFSTYENAKWKGCMLQLQFAKEYFYRDGEIRFF